MTVDSMITIVISVLSSGGLWTGLQYIVGRRAEARRQEALAADRKDERNKMLVDAQAVAQRTALDSADRALQQVTERCDTCFDELHALRLVAENLVDAFETFLDDETPANRLAVRGSIRAMRQAL